MRFKDILVAAMCMLMWSNVQGAEEFKGPLNDGDRSGASFSYAKIRYQSTMQPHPFNKIYGVMCNDQSILSGVYCFKRKNPPYAQFGSSSEKYYTNEEKKNFLEQVSNRVEPSIFNNKYGKTEFILYADCFRWGVNSNDYVPAAGNSWPYKIVGFFDSDYLFYARPSEVYAQKYAPYFWGEDRMTHFRTIVDLLGKCELRVESSMLMQNYCDAFFLQGRQGDLVTLATSTVSLLNLLDLSRGPDRCSYVTLFWMLNAIIENAQNNFEPELQSSMNQCMKIANDLGIGYYSTGNFFIPQDTTPFDYLYVGAVSKLMKQLNNGMK